MATTTHPSTNDESGNDADDSEEYDDEGNDDAIQNIYLHICNEEGREFTGVTTFHGMIRLFTSRTWTSLIFWVLVLSTCLVFFMIFSGYILSSYAKAATFMRRYSEAYSVEQVSLLICGSPINRLIIDIRGEFLCHPPCNEMEWQITSSYSRLRSATKISIEFSRTKDVLIEVRKMAVTDVLSSIGGGTSLFLGCSCVTLMETFIFLLKLVLQSIHNDVYNGVNVKDGFDVKEVEDVIADPTSMQSPPRKSIHCAR
ncbi:hypothetical protein NECAME_02860 [Necator americanus]|uniref:Amiloride-sensitive sodium channel n=1 Tax=Necator americanus TaxID=51031 RepID=W2TCH1_NECAM|nr:hypothetical protein NECAME_02860 [Necator americanus]ETN78712.1 hypothetical protein NECAME_02860 [Necator americanus]